MSSGLFFVILRKNADFNVLILVHFGEFLKNMANSIDITGIKCYNFI